MTELGFFVAWARPPECGRAELFDSVVPGVWTPGMVDVANQ